jgi:methylmalonyl-CoA mutase N-terminal domain/subunit
VEQHFGERLPHARSGATAVQELAFTIANGLAYLDAARARGLDVTTIARRMSFFFNAHNHLFEEVAKFRAARSLWARLLTERFAIEDGDALKLRFHTQTAGSMLTAQQPHNNIVRTTVQALAAVLGGTQSLHTNSYDEALGLPPARRRCWHSARSSCSRTRAASPTPPTRSPGRTSSKR